MILKVSISRLDLANYFKEFIAPKLSLPSDLEWCFNDHEVDDEGELLRVEFIAEKDEPGD